MPTRIDDYAIIGNCQTAALVSKEGAIDWLCFPRFDSEACFAALLGTADHGRWLLAPDTKIRHVRRRYLEDTLVLETEFTTYAGTVAVIDFMSSGEESSDVVRIVEGRGGKVPMQMDLRVRLDTGRTVPWVRPVNDGIVAVAGAEALRCKSNVKLTTDNADAQARFSISEGERIPFVLTFFPSFAPEPPSIHAKTALKHTRQWWRDWVGQGTYPGPYREAVVRSLIVLKALTYQPTGGIIAAPTTSLPADLGGDRNWDYRYCWLRDATLTLHALMIAGYTEETCAWRDWLLRAIAGKASQVQPLYGLTGERRLPEFTADWLPGFRDSRPVRIGNAASVQNQLDVYGELLDVFHTARKKGIPPEAHAWDIQKALLFHLETAWQKPDHGIWEVRGKPRHYTHSKVMAWVAMDRAVKSIEEFGLDGPALKWKQLREKIHREICRQGFSPARNSFVQTYDNQALDASLLLIPLVGFLPSHDERVQGTVEAVQKHLTVDGLVLRYDSKESADPHGSGEGAFLLCSFWLVRCLAKLGRRDEAIQLYEKLLALRNDLGLLSEQYNPQHQQLLGNFPQAFSHLGLISAAFELLPEDQGGDPQIRG